MVTDFAGEGVIISFATFADLHFSYPVAAVVVDVKIFDYLLFLHAPVVVVVDGFKSDQIVVIIVTKVLSEANLFAGKVTLSACS